MAWAMELAEWVGFLKTEPQDNRARAYKRAHEACQWLRLQLADAEVLEVSEQRIGYRSRQRGLEHIEQKGERLLRCSNQTRGTRSVPLHRERFQQPMLDRPHPLGSGGRVSFKLDGSLLAIELLATDEQDGERGEHAISLRLQVSLAPDGLRP
jgi:hypothetical protein